MKRPALLTDQGGVTAVEFALIAPVLLMFMFLLIEGGRMEWTQQTLQEVSTNTARCMALGQDACSSTSAIQSYAQSRGSAWGVSLASATITATTGQTCAGVSGMSRISISLPYRSVMNLLPIAQQALTATACYPSIS
jgi:Flp pilus assembly protein TadG